MRTPIEIKELKGRPIPPEQRGAKTLRVEHGAPEQPVNLSPDAKKAWVYFSRLLQGMGVLARSDGAALGRLCECWAEIERIKRAQKKRKWATQYETTGTTGQQLMRAYPDVAQLADADRRFQHYCGTFGLSPAARTRINAIGAGDDAETEAFFS